MYTKFQVPRSPSYHVAGSSKMPPPEAILTGRQDDLYVSLIQPSVTFEILVRSTCQGYQIKDYIMLMQFPKQKSLIFQLGWVKSMKNHPETAISLRQ